MHARGRAVEAMPNVTPRNPSRRWPLRAARSMWAGHARGGARFEVAVPTSGIT